jgi:hypothetical protein
MNGDRYSIPHPWMNRYTDGAESADPIFIAKGSPRSVWPSISYHVHMQNLRLQGAVRDPELFINFLATRETHIAKKHLKYASPNTSDELISCTSESVNASMCMRECTWEREYKSLLTGEELRYYQNIFTFVWHRIAVAKNMDQKWDSYWCQRSGTGARGTIIFARSINSQILCEVDVHFSPDYITMYTEKLRITTQSAHDEVFDKKMANWLLMTKFWSIPLYPFPRMDLAMMDGTNEFILGGGIESAIISDEEPIITDTYHIIRLLNEKINERYVRTLIAYLKQ